MHIGYLAVSLDKELNIYEVLTGALVRKIPTEQPFEILLRVNPTYFKFEFGMIAEACIGYSYKTFFECGVCIATPGMADHHFLELQEIEKNRKRTYFKLQNKPNAITSFCQIEAGNENYIVVTPREEQDTVVVFKLSLQ